MSHRPWASKLAAAALAALAVTIAASADATKTCPDVPMRLHSYGSDTMQTLMDAWTAQVKQCLGEVSVLVEARASVAAIPKLKACKADLAPMSRRPTPEELAGFREAFGYPPTIVPVAIEALSLYVHKDNPLERSTLIELDSVFSTTRKCGHFYDIRVWHELDPQFGARRPITLYGLSNFSLFQKSFRELVLCEGAPKPYRVMPDTRALIAAIASDRDGIGFGGRVADAHALGVKPLALATVEGEPFVEPSDDKVSNGSYPPTRPLFVVVGRVPGQPLPVAVQEFLCLALSEQGQRIAQDLDYAPLSPAQQEQAWGFTGIDRERCRCGRP